MNKRKAEEELNMSSVKRTLFSSTYNQVMNNSDDDEDDDDDSIEIIKTINFDYFDDFEPYDSEESDTDDADIINDDSKSNKKDSELISNDSGAIFNDEDSISNNENDEDDEVSPYKLFPLFHCVECGLYLGKMNPRQLCQKTYCDNKEY